MSRPRLRKPSWPGRRPSWPASRAGSVTLVVVLLAGVLVATVGTGYSVSHPLLGDGSEYVAKGHTVTHVNGETGKSDADLARSLAKGKERLETVRLPDGRVAIVNNDTGEVTFVDAATMTPTGAGVDRPGSKGKVEVLPTGSRGYLLDRERGTVEEIDAQGQPVPAPVQVPDGIADAVPSGDSIWLVTRKGDVIEVADGRQVRTVRLGGTPSGITVADGHPVVVTGDGTAYGVDGDAPRSLGDTGLHGATVVLASWRGTGLDVVGVDRATGRVAGLNPRTGHLVTVGLKLPRAGTDLDAPVVLGSRVYVPDRSGPNLWKVDLAKAKADDKPLEVPGQPGEFELMVSGGKVWANSQYDRRLLVVDGNGAATYLDKGPGSDVTDSQSDDAATGGSSTPSNPTGGPPPPADPLPIPAGAATPTGKLVTVPSFPRGTPYQTACTKLGQLGLGCDPEPGGDDPGLRTGDVLGTNPAAGSQAPEHSQVLVRYVAPLKAPRVLGLTHQGACDQLKALSFGCAATVSPRPAAAPEQLDVVATQNPQPGADIAKGGTVAITYPDSIALPSFSGLSQGEACTRIQTVYKMACRAQVGKPALGPAQTAGAVYDQNPSTGTAVKLGATVTIIVYSGTNTVGDYVNPPPQQIDAACAKVVADGFQCNKVEGRTAAGTGQQPGTVYAQNPAAGTKQNIGLPITLTYYSGNNDLPNYVGSAADASCGDITARGFACSALAEPFNAPPNRVERQDQAPGRYPLGTAITIHYSKWTLVHYVMYQHNSVDAWVLRPEGSIPSDYGRAVRDVGFAYAAGTRDVPWRAVNGFFCTAAAASCHGMSPNHFYSAIGSYPAPWSAPTEAAVFLSNCNAPGSHEVYRTWSDTGGARHYNIDAGPTGTTGNELLGCVF